MLLSQSLLDQILKLANEAGKHLARFYQQDVKIQTKSDNTPVTEADLFVSQFLIEKLTALLTEKRNRLIEQIDSHAAAIYSTWTRFESEYRERQTAAETYKAANYQGDCSRYITDFAKRAGLNNKAATDLILVQAAGLEKLQMELANQRMRKYELKAPNLTLEQLQSIYDDIIKQMDHLMEAYNNG